MVYHIYRVSGFGLGRRILHDLCLLSDYQRMHGGFINPRWEAVSFRDARKTAKCAGSPVTSRLAGTYPANGPIPLSELPTIRPERREMGLRRLPRLGPVT